MIQIKLIKDNQLGKKNSVVVVTRNIAHGLVDRGEGEIYKPTKIYKNRMLSSRRRR